MQDLISSLNTKEHHLAPQVSTSSCTTTGDVHNLARDMYAYSSTANKQFHKFPGVTFAVIYAGALTIHCYWRASVLGDPWAGLTIKQNKPVFRALRGYHKNCYDMKLLYSLKK